MAIVRELRKWLLMSLACISLYSCREGVVIDEFVALPNVGWNADSLAVFRADIDDASKSYDMWIQVRNDNTYPYANLWLFVEVVSAKDGVMVRDTVECTLAKPDGEWLGGGWGSLYAVDCPYRLNTKFALSGRYTFRIIHGMREEDIKGIHSLGLRIEESNGEE